MKDLDDRLSKSGTALGAYRYTPLDSERREIRLLIVEGSSDPDDPIIASIDHVSLLEGRTPAYETISYCWGETNFSGKIQIDGQILRITINAERSIRRMRYSYDRRTLWIDSVCINQADGMERSQQVGLMYDIFGRTARNLVWLGESRQDVEPSLRAVLNDMQSALSNGDTLMDKFWTEEGRFRPIPSAFNPDVDFEPLLELYESAWFTRGWIVQEAVVPNETRCHYGNEDFDLAEILEAAAWLFHKRISLPPYNETWTDHRGIWKAFTIWELRLRYKKLTDRPYPMHETLLHLLAIMRRFQTTNPRDHVYGLLALHQGLTQNHTVLRLLNPNYDQTLAEVYRQATLGMIAEGTGLAFLRHLNEDEDGLASSWPSWIPKWHMTPKTSALAHIFHADRFGVLEPTTAIRSDHMTLIVEGIEISRIASCSWPFIVENDDASHIHSIITDELEKMTTTTLGRVLIAGENDTDDPPSDEFCRYLEPYLDYLSTHNAFPPPQSKVTDTQIIKAAAYHEACHQRAQNRRYFITASGLPGLGPHMLCENDVLAILFGCRWPVVLRACSSGNFRVVGVCYVDGIMHGEALGLRKETFRLA